MNWFQSSKNLLLWRDESHIEKNGSGGTRAKRAIGRGRIQEDDANRSVKNPLSRVKKNSFENQYVCMFPIDLGAACEAQFCRRTYLTKPVLRILRDGARVVRPHDFCRAYHRRTLYIFRPRPLPIAMGVGSMHFNNDRPRALLAAVRWCRGCDE